MRIDLRTQLQMLIIVLVVGPGAAFGHDVEPAIRLIQIFGVGNTGTFQVIDRTSCTATINVSVNDPTIASVTPLLVTNSNRQTFTVTARAIGETVIQIFWTGTPPACLDQGRDFMRVRVCADPVAPTLQTFSEAGSGDIYEIIFSTQDGVSTYEIQESTSPDFSNVTTTIARGAGGGGFSFREPFQHGSESETAFYYRVRGIEDCNQLAGPFSAVERTVVVNYRAMAPPIRRSAPQRSNPFIQKMLMPHPSAGKVALDHVSYTATTDKAWLTVSPPSGTIPNSGTTLDLTVDPSKMPVGSSTATVTVTNSANGSTILTAPVTITLTTPVATVGKGLPPSNALIIPAVAHLDSANARFESDVRVTNKLSEQLDYQFTFTPSASDGTRVGKQTSFAILPGETVALNDILKASFGLGVLPGETAGGTLEIRPLKAPDETTITAIASSRTYAVTANGTLGQFIPAIPFANFVGSGSVLSLQQLAESEAYRTNLGLVEGSGQPASVQVTALNAQGQSLGTFPVELGPGEHRQLNAFLRTQGITLADGRIEVRVTSATGRITAYASVVDNKTDDPLLVPPVEVARLSESRYVIPGVADLNNPLASWRTDIRLYNGTPVPTTATLTFYPQNEPSSSRSTTLTIQPGQVRAIDNALQLLFGLQNTGGSIVVTTSNPTALVVTARTYNQTANGTYGQFIPAVAPSKGIGIGSEPLQILQLEESSDFRTNVGLVEMTGNPVSVRIDGYVPESKIATSMSVDLQANEFKQLVGLLRQLNLGVAHNARIAVTVVSGNGRVTAYGSVVDNRTQDPTYVPAQ